MQLPPISDWHNGKVARLNQELLPSLLGRAIVLVQKAVRLDGHNEPQPALALLRFPGDFYETGKPTPSDILLPVAVSDRSIGCDRGPKLPACARAVIPECGLSAEATGALHPIPNRPASPWPLTGYPRQLGCQD